MKNEFISLREAASTLGVPAYVIVYAIVSGKTTEPLRIANRRMFSQTDLDRLRKVLAKGAK